MAASSPPKSHHKRFPIIRIFLFLSIIPFLQWSAVRPAVQRHTMLVEYAEHGTSACETADSEDIINAVPLVVHVHDVLLTLQLRQCPFRLLGRTDILLQMDDVSRCLAQHGTLRGQYPEHTDDLRRLRVGK